MSAISAVPGDKFTDEMLAKNFVAIAGAFKDTERWISHLEGHVTELFEMAKAAAETQAKVKTPGRVKPFFLGAVVGVVGYRYYKKNIHKINVVIENVNNTAKETANTVAEKLEGTTSV